MTATYTYKGKRYRIFNKAKMKKWSSLWFEAIIYYPVDRPTEMFVRDVSDFDAKFEVVEED